MFQITPIGSCRIATPLRLSRETFGFQLNQTGTYGYTHSSAEAVQLMRYLKGEFEIDPAIAPLLSRRAFAGKQQEEAHRPADMYIVELSSAKVLQIGATCIQLNYLNTEYSEFFGDRTRATRFWAISAEGDQAAVEQFLAETWSANASQRQDAQILRQIQFRFCTDAELRQDVRTLMSGLPAVLFTTHVDALTPEGLPIPSRSQFIRKVEAAVLAEGGRLYNPTAAMLRLGQDRAIEDNSDSLAHFTEEFSRVVFEDWFDQAIAPTLDRLIATGGSPAVQHYMTPHVAARLEAGDVASLVRRLQHLAKRQPTCVALGGLLASAYAAQGDLRDALATLRGIEAGQSDPALTLQRLEIAIEIGDAKDVQACLARLADLKSVISGDTRFAAADLLVQAGCVDAALAQYWQEIRRSPGQQRAAQALVDLALSTSPDILSDLGPNDLRHLQSLLDLPRLMAVLHLTGAHDDLIALVGSNSKINVPDLRVVLHRFLAAADIDGAARLIAAWRQARSSERITDPDLRALIDSWVEQATALADHERSLALIRAALIAMPAHVQGRIALRDRRRALLETMRKASADRDIGRLNALLSAVRHIPEVLGELALARMRLLFEAEDYGAAAAAARQVIEVSPDSPIAWATLMRCSARTGTLIELDHAATRILSFTDDDSQRLVDEAQDRLARLPAQCLRAVRDTVQSPLQAYRLLSVARRDATLEKPVEFRLKRLEKQLIQDLRDPAMQAAPGFGDFAAEVAALLPGNDQVRLVVGRYLVKRRDFVAALPHWEHLLASHPTNADFAVQLNRCRDAVLPRLLRREGAGA